jgi:phosphoglycolate phosphatase
MKQLIIFDMDGTLVDSSTTLTNAINHVRANLSLQPMCGNTILRKLNDHTVNPAKYFYEAEFFTTEHETWFSQYYRENHKNEVKLYSGIKELLQELKNIGFKLAIATNAYKVSANQALIYLNIKKYFDAVVCGDEVEQGKPNPYMLYRVLDEVNIEAKNTLFIGDGERDREAAKNANINYIMVHWGFSIHSKENAVNSVNELKKKILEFF